MTEVKEDNPPTDEEGLRLHYDVIIVGTGLVQSILASALARAGKAVLHTDCADFYGELDAVWTLPYLESQKNLGDQSSLFPSHKAAVEKKAGPSLIPLSPHGSLHDLQLHSMGRVEPQSFQLGKGTAVRIPVWGRATVLGWKACEDYDDNDDLLDEPPDERDYRLVLELTDWKLSNGKCAQLRTMDIDNVVTMQQEAADEILNQRSRSFAIDVTPGLIWAQGPAVLGLLQSSVSDYVEFKSLERLWWFDESDKSLQAVPCSKNDVFASKLLSPMEKRRLMKFLQLALDYSVAEAEAAEQATATGAREDGTVLPAAWETLNERHLNQGRSLARPQNKSVSASGLVELQGCIRDQIDFEEYLSTHAKLSKKLSALVRYALALDFGTHRMTVGQGMQSLGQHLQSLGRFGTTAFLVPLFGSGELSQAFCRSAAVYGATYLLRRCAASVHCTPDGLVEGVNLKPHVDEENASAHENGAPTKLIKSSCVVVPEHALMKTKPSAKRVLRRVSVLHGRPTTAASVRHAVLVPPKALKQSKHAYTIHGLWFDESVNVTPLTSDGKGCSMLHLTTVVDSESVNEAVLQEAVQSMLGESSVTEIYNVTFSYPLYEPSEEVKATEGLHVIQRPQPALTVDGAFDQARKLFSSICPNVEFLTLSKEIDTLVKERFGDRLEEDDEQVALSNAMNLIQSTGKASEPLFVWLGDPNNKGGQPDRLLLPVPRPVEPSVPSLEVDSIVQLIEEYGKSEGHDPRVYFATCSGANRDTLEFTDLIKTTIERVNQPSLQFQAFTNGVSGTEKLNEVGLSGIQVSLFAPDAKAYSEATGLGEENFQSACNLIRELSNDGVSVEVGLLEDHAGAGRVFARELGAWEVHVFSSYS